MEMSETFLRIHFLNALRNARPSNRYQMVQNITPGQMGAIAEVSYHVISGLIPILIVDRDYFRRKRLMLRQLSATRVSFMVKRRVLLHNIAVLPRLLRIVYLHRIIRYIVRLNEE